MRTAEPLTNGDTVRLLPDAPVPEMERSCRGRTGRVASVDADGAMVLVFRGTGTVGPGCFPGGTVGPVRGDWVDREDEVTA